MSIEDDVNQASVLVDMLVADINEAIHNGNSHNVILCALGCTLKTYLSMLPKDKRDDDWNFFISIIDRHLKSLTS